MFRPSVPAQHIYTLLFRLCLIMVAVAIGAVSSAATGLESCEAAATAAGVNLISYAHSVGHSIHSITVEDVQYFFDPDFPIENTIPTANVRYGEGEKPVLASAPSGNSPFKFPGFAAFDFVLSNNDGPETFLAVGMSTLEKLAHQLHMIEMWSKASPIYKDIKARQVDKASVCPCLVDEHNNGIVKHLNYIYKELKDWMKHNTRDTRRNGRALDLALITWYPNDRERNAKSLDPEKVYSMPELKDSKSWAFWKKLSMKNGMEDGELFNIAMYMYCKTN